MSARAPAARVLLGAVGLIIGVAAVLALREATLSTHQQVQGASRTDLIVNARSRGAEQNQTLRELVEAVLLSCRLEVASDLAGEIEPLGDGRFRASLVPPLDQTNRRQFRGCVEDWTLDQVKLDVLTLVSAR